MLTGIFPNPQATRETQALMVLQGFASCPDWVLGWLGDAVGWKGGVDALTGTILLLQEWWGNNLPAPSSQEIHTLQKNRCQNWGLKPKMEVTTRDLCPKLGWGDLAWRQLSLWGVMGEFPSFHAHLAGAHSLRNPPGFLAQGASLSGLSSARLHPHCSSPILSLESALAPIFIVPSPDLGVLDSLFLI